MKNKKLNLIISTFAIGMVGVLTTIIVANENIGFALARATDGDLTLRLDNSSNLVTSSEYQTYVNKEYHYASFKFTRAKALVDGLCTLNSYGKIYKTDETKGLKSITATFTGGLRVVTSFDQDFTYITKKTLTSGEEMNIAGNYFYVVATEETNVVSLVINYSCQIESAFNKSNFSKTSLSLNNNSNWTSNTRTDLAGFARFDNKIYYYVKGTFSGNAVAECFKYYNNKPTDALSNSTFLASILDLNGTNMTLYFDISNVTSDRLASHLAFNDAAWNGSDGNIAYSSGTHSGTDSFSYHTGEGSSNSTNAYVQVFNGQRYAISIRWKMANISLFRARNYFALGKQTGEYHLEQDGDKLAFVASYRYSGTWNDSVLSNTKLWTTKENVEHTLASSAYKAKVDEDRNIADLYFDISNYTVIGNSWLKVSTGSEGIQIGTAEIRTPYNRNEYAFCNGYKYTIGYASTYNSVYLTVADASAQTKVYCSKDQMASLEVRDDKAYYVVYGSSVGATQEDLESKLKIDLFSKNNFTTFDIIEKQDNGLFKALLDVTNVSETSAYPHLQYDGATATNQSNSDMKDNGRSLGQPVTLGNYVYYIYNNGADSNNPYGMPVVRKVAKLNTLPIDRESLYLEEIDGLPHLVVRGHYFGESLDSTKMVLTGANNSYSIRPTALNLDTTNHKYVAKFNIENMDGTVELYFKYNSTSWSGVSSHSGRLHIDADYISCFAGTVSLGGRDFKLISDTGYASILIK